MNKQSGEAPLLHEAVKRPCSEDTMLKIKCCPPLGQSYKGLMGWEEPLRSGLYGMMWARIWKHYRDLKDRQRCLINQGTRWTICYSCWRSPTLRAKTHKECGILSWESDCFSLWENTHSTEGSQLEKEESVTNITATVSSEGDISTAVSEWHAALIVFITFTIKWTTARRNEWIR